MKKTIILLLLLHVSFFTGMAANFLPKGNKKDKKKREIVKNDTINNPEDVKEALNILSIFFPNEILIDSALAISLRDPETSQEIQVNTNIQFFKIEHDTLNNNLEVNSDEIERTMDNMVNVWEVKEYLAKEKKDSFLVKKQAFSLIPDSVFIDRLNKIPSLIHLPYNQVVRNYIEVYSEKRKEQVEVMLGLSEYYFPIFEQALDEYDLPNELKYLPIIESALNPRARSRAGATGLWQFMYGTGKLYGLETNSFVDERKDPIRSTYAAVNFLNDLYKQFNDWTLVIAAYNCGPGNVKKAIRRSGGKKDYWEIYYYLPRETRGYVPAFIGASYIMNYHKTHGLFAKKIEMPTSVDTLIINEKLHLEQVANVLKLPIDMIREMNPQYTRDIIPASGKSYTLKLPEKETLHFIDLRDSIFAYKDSFYFSKTRTREIAARRTKRYRYNAPSKKGLVKVLYEVKSGDNLGFIASWFNVRKSDLRYWNNIYRNRIYAGKRLAVFVPKGSAGKYQKINAMSFDEKQAMIGKTSKPMTTYVTQSLSANNQQSGKYLYYKVRRGDNLWTIARKYPGISNTDIKRINNLSDFEVQHLKPGDILKIKKI